MIEFLLVLPVIVVPIIWVMKSRTINRIILAIYVLGNIGSAVLLFTGKIASITLIQSITPFFSNDGLSSLFFYVMVAIFACSAVLSHNFLKHSSDDRWDSLYTIFIMLFVASMIGVIFSAHLGLFWVFIEATTLSSAVLLYYERTRSSLEATWKYIFVCSIGISFAFVGIIMLTIGAHGYDSLYFKDLNANAAHFSPFWLKMAFVFILTGFGTKMGLAPMHSWLPDAHSEAPSPVSALMSGALLNGALLGIIRTMTILDISGLGHYARGLLLVAGIISVGVSAIFMLNVHNFKRLLAYSSIEHMGIIAIGIALGGPALFGAMLHLVGHSLSKGSLFLTAGTIYHRYETKDINSVKGLFKRDRVTALLFTAGIFSITAFPPFSTFLSEFIIVKEMFVGSRFILAGVFLFLLTVVLYAACKPLLAMITGKSESDEQHKFSVLDHLPQIVMLVVVIIIGLYIPDSAREILQSAASAISSR
jgi:hydrogenase-4 component F